MAKEILQPTRVSFQISDVDLCAERLPEITVRAALERTAKSILLTCSNPKHKVLEAGDFHPLIAAAALAYKKHYPLVLSPDMIWLTILQGVAQHIANHPEVLRSRLVLHQTAIELVVPTTLDRLPETDSEMLTVTGCFIEKIKKHLLPGKEFLLEAEFSTTTDLDLIAGSIVMMDAFQPYFDYVFSIICGIPSVTLEGTTADWELLLARVQSLHESDLDISWWTKHLLPLCGHFVRASRGDVDQQHWNNLCKLVERYGVDDLNGWLLKFIPYVRKERNEKPSHPNPVLELSEFPLDNHKMGEITGCTSNMLPTGLSFAPVTCMNLGTGTTMPYQFAAGFAGVTQLPEDLSLRPTIGWAITEPPRIDKLLARLRDEHQVDPPERTETELLLSIFDRNVPGDLWRFYMETGGATLGLKEPNKDDVFCSIKPLRQVKVAIEFNSVGRELKYLSDQGLLSPNDYDDRCRFALAYSRFHLFAEAYEGKKHFYYVFGDDPERFDGDQFKESRGRIFRWTGEPNRESFQPVAHTFSDWLESMLGRNRVSSETGES